jgi:hypothetical protein
MINLILVFFFHFLADFIFQTREMADNKGKSIYWLTRHVFVYSLVMITIWPFFGIDAKTLGLIFIVSFTTHWITDFITSKITGYFYLKNNMRAFFSTIGFDQFIHATTLTLTYNYLVKEIIC